MRHPIDRARSEADRSAHNTPIFHWSDIDADGTWIFHTKERATGRAVRPHLMSIEIAEKLGRAPSKKAAPAMPTRTRHLRARCVPSGEELDLFCLGPVLDGQAPFSHLASSLTFSVMLRRSREGRPIPTGSRAVICPGSVVRHLPRSWVSG
ncbi:Wadjet anti-phage system protein JetD domain-containing protein [Bradyrhizobium sp. TZ2]